MMPYNSYQLYQVERAKSPAEVRRADEQAGRLASAASSLLRGITRPVRAMGRSSPDATRRLPLPRPTRADSLNESWSPTRGLARLQVEDG